MPEIEITTRPTAISGAPGPGPDRPRVELILSPETGAETIRADNSKASTRTESIAKIRAAAAKAGRSGKLGGVEAAGTGAEGEEDAGETTDDEAATEEGEATTDDVGDDAGEAAAEDEAPADDEAAPEEAEAAPAKKPAAKKPVEPPADDETDVGMAARVDAERLARENDALRARVEGFEVGLFDDEARTTYFENPAAYVRAHLSNLFGLPPDDPALKKEVVDLLTDLTVEVAGGQISEDKIAQLENERVSRQWRIQQKTRKATTKAATERAEREAAANEIESVYLKAAEAQFPFVALAAELDGIRPGKAVLDTLRRAASAGVLKTEGRREIDIITEALRLTNHSYKARAEKIAARFAKAPAAAQAKPGSTTTKPGSPKTSEPSATKKPRTISAAEAGSPPAKSGKPHAKDTGPKTITVVRDPDADEARRRSILAKYKRQRSKP